MVGSGRTLESGNGCGGIEGRGSIQASEGALSYSPMSTAQSPFQEMLSSPYSHHMQAIP